MMDKIVRQEGRDSKLSRCFFSRQEIMKDNLQNTCAAGVGPASEGRMGVLRQYI